MFWKFTNKKMRIKITIKRRIVKGSIFSLTNHFLCKRDFCFETGAFNQHPTTGNAKLWMKNTWKFLWKMCDINLEQSLQQAKICRFSSFYQVCQGRAVAHLFYTCFLCEKSHVQSLASRNRDGKVLSLKPWRAISHQSRKY